MPHHRIDSVFDTIITMFGNRVIAYQYPNSYPGALHCPPYLPDLNPCDFFLWGYTKDLVYKKKPTDLISFKRSVTGSLASIKRKTLELVTDNFVTRLRYCIISDGCHFENILH
ncbi:hypothetical protein AVEN_145175-1 [Araneus ventricosus]|uniref:Tc1-like transposase DDE domain-containing protein n=1 Tax=Araneus ventricosus TaxID=182803 RepID=A0A4Y2WJL6_ARAVE|nr:hypothetical protein AVEN_258676-1 [Araneus ventricosus]GBO37242.1 hypothetical protein AVEN_259650-1 [Araneus ventricosus]GBO37243.1 hypothetical protein AVEN_8756-1 [Araneus ventricosus]GBO37246.1 hypothetical protein AVEN_145175-1 [Araneus ventricosus]